MSEFRLILAEVDLNGGSRQTAAKAVALARLTGAHLELFHCDAARAYAQRHQYDAQSAAVSRESCLAELRGGLAKLWNELAVRDVPVRLASACESPLYQGIVREVWHAQPDLVVRGAGSDLEGARAARGWGASDWDLVRTCPAPLLLTRGKLWKPKPAIAAAVDLSREESADLTRAILRAADGLARHARGTLDIVHARRFDGASPAELKSCRTDLALLVKAVSPEYHMHAEAGLVAEEEGHAETVH